LTSNIDYETPTWNQIYEMLLNQAQKIQRQNYKPDVIIGIARGGIIPARILLDLLETPQLASIQIEFYTDINQTQQEPTLKYPLTTKITGKKTLLVDDISDTGKSLKFAKTHLQQHSVKEVKTATLFQKPKSTEPPDFYEKQTNHWVVFPWDTKETLRKIIQKQQSELSLNQEVNKLTKKGVQKKIIKKLLKDM